MLYIIKNKKLYTTSIVREEGVYVGTLIEKPSCIAQENTLEELMIALDRLIDIIDEEESISNR